MKVTVKLFGTLRSRVPQYDVTAGIDLVFEDPVNVRQIVSHLGLPEKQIGIVTINEIMARAGDPVPDNALVRIFQPLTGG